MLLLYSFKCGPITAHVHEAESGWTVVVRLFDSQKSNREISNIGLAQKVAISYAHQLCLEHEVTCPSGLDAPHWALARQSFDRLTQMPFWYPP